MRIGLLRSRIEVQQQTSSVDSIGQPLDTWTTIKTLWADIRLSKGMEVINADMPTSMVKASIRVRYTTGVHAGMRIVHNNTIFNILSVQPDIARKEYVDFVCEIVE
jgi:SPP1 family predicted phage head-tail adaptor